VERKLDLSQNDSLPEFRKLRNKFAACKFFLVGLFLKNLILEDQKGKI